MQIKVFAIIKYTWHDVVHRRSIGRNQTRNAIYIVKIVSACKTYKETLKCLTLNEAEMYAEAARNDGDTASIVAPAK